MSFLEDRTRFLSTFGQAILSWNSAEARLRYLLVVICGKQPSTYVLTAGLGSQGLLQALRAISPTQKPEVAEAIKAVCAYYETIRGYRNYYVHGFTAMAFRDNQAFGAIAMMEARDVFRIAEDYVAPSELETLIERCDLLGHAIAAIIDTLEPVEGAMAHPVLPTSQSLHPPGKLVKTLRYPIKPPSAETS